MRVLAGFAGMRRGGFAVAIVLTCAIEGVLCLVLSVEGRHHVLGGIDGRVYNQLGINLADHGRFSEARTPPYAPSVFRTPGYPAMLAGLRLIFGGSLNVVRLVQFLLVAVTALLVWDVIARLSSELAGRLAAIITATYLPLIWLAREHISDVLCTALAAAAIASLVRARSQGGKRARAWYALLGVIGAAASLVRPEFAAAIAAIAICAIIWPGAGSRRHVSGSVAIMLAVFVVLIVPWAARNYSVTHRVIPFGTASGTSLYASALQWSGTISMQFSTADFQTDGARTNAIIAPIQAQEARRHRSPAHTEVAINDALTRAARRVAQGLSVGEVISRLPKRIAYQWSVADEPPGPYTFWHDVDRIQYFLLLVLVAAGGVTVWRRRRHLPISRLWPLLVLAVTFTAVHLIFSEQPRYSMPARPWLIGIGAIGLAAALERLVARRQAPGWPDHSVVVGER